MTRDTPSPQPIRTPQMTAGEAGDPIWEQPAPPLDPHRHATAPREESVPCGRLIELSRPRPRNHPPQPS